MQLAEAASSSPPVSTQQTEMVPALPHENNESPSSTPPPKQRKQTAELNPAPWPLPDPPPRPQRECSSTSSEASSVATDDIVTQSLLATQGQDFVPTDSEEVTVTESAFLENESPSSSEFHRKKITTVKKITTSKPTPMRMLRPPLPVSPSDSSGSGRAVQRWTADPPSSHTTQMYADSELLQKLHRSENEVYGMHERIRELESQNRRITEMLAEREQGFWMAAGQYQQAHHDSVDSLTAQLAQQSAAANARIACLLNLGRIPVLLSGGHSEGGSCRVVL